MFRYAQLDENMICVADSDLHSIVEAPHMIQIELTVESPLGKRWTGSEFETVEE
jgi:hypothetical protein